MRFASSRRALIASVAGICAFSALQAVAWGAGTLSVEECVSLAVKVSPAAQARENGLKTATLSLQDASAALRPTLGNSFSVANTEADTTISGNLNLRVPFGQALSTKGSLANPVAFAAAERDMSWEDAQAAYARGAATIALATKVQFFKVIGARADYRVASASVDRYDNLVLPDARSQKARGLASDADVMKAEALSAIAKIALRRAAQSMATQESALATMTGLASIPALSLPSPDEAAVLKLLGRPLAESVSGAVSKRFEVQVAEHDTERARMSLAAKRMALSPRLGVGGSVKLAAASGESQVSLGASIGDVVKEGAFGASLSFADATAPTASDKAVYGANVSLSLPTVVDLSLGVTTAFKGFTLSFSAPLLSDSGKSRRDATRAAMAYDDAVKASEAKAKAVSADVESARSSLLDAYDGWKIAAMNVQVDELLLKEKLAGLKAGAVSQVAYADAVAGAADGQTKYEQAGLDLILATDRMKLALGE